MTIKISGTTIKNPTSFRIERFNLTYDAGRVASGLMVMDFIAVKRKFVFGYEVISGVEMNTIIDLLEAPPLFVTLTYDENGETKTATVYAGAIPTDKFRTDGVWYWKNMNFSLIER